MDKTKLTVLRQIGYTIPKHCGICVHGIFAADGAAVFGTCALYRYDHQKHTERKDLSVHRTGSCPTGFDLDEDKLRRQVTLDWEEFVDKRRFTRNNRHKAKTHY